MDNLSWVVDECIGELGKSVAPCDLLERLFADPRCPAFGADHCRRVPADSPSERKRG